MHFQGDMAELVDAVHYQCAGEIRGGSSPPIPDLRGSRKASSLSDN